MYPPGFDCQINLVEVKLRDSCRLFRAEHFDLTPTAVTPRQSCSAQPAHNQRFAPGDCHLDRAGCFHLALPVKLLYNLRKI